MGYSCSKAAHDVMEFWMKICKDQTGIGNEYIDRGNRYFIEWSRREHFDGSITGSIHKIVKEDETGVYAQKTGSFRINGNGSIERAPAFLKNMGKEINIHNL